MQDKPPLAPIVMAIVGIGLFAAMDAVMKGASLAVGAFSAFFLRCIIGFFKEDVHPRAYLAAILGLAGVAIIVAGKLGRADMGDDALWGLAALLLSAVLYAWNLVLQRQQALVAKPAEVSMFQNGMVVVVLLAGTPFLLEWPQRETWNYLGAGAVFAVGATLCLSWAYARAEAQRLVPIEYSAFLWAVVFGWFLYDESVTFATIAGAALIVLGCWIATRHKEKADRNQPIDPIH